MKRKHVLSIVLLVALLAGCSPSQHAQVDKIIPPLSDAWFQAQEMALSLHDSGVLTGANWEKTREIQAQGSVIMRRVWSLWLTERRIDSGDYGALLQLIADLQKIISGVKQ